MSDVSVSFDMVLHILRPRRFTSVAPLPVDAAIFRQLTSLDLPHYAPAGLCWFVLLYYGGTPTVRAVYAYSHATNRTM